MLAIVAGHREVARLLLCAGVNLALKGSGAPAFADKTARDLAIARGMADLFAETEPGPPAGGPDR